MRSGYPYGLSRSPPPPSPLYFFRAATVTNYLVCAGLCVSFFYAQDPLLVEVLAVSKYDVHPEREKIEIDCLAPLTTQNHKRHERSDDRHHKSPTHRLIFFAQ